MLKRYGNILILVNEVTQPAIASEQAVLGDCVFAGLVVRPDGTNEVTLNVYDSEDASGDRLLPSNLKVSGTGGLWAIGFNPGVSVEIGIYVDLAVAGGGSVEYQVLYDHG